MRGRVKILGFHWTYKMMTLAEFLQLHPECEDSGALCLIKKRQIHFIDEELSLGIVRHEVRHAFLSCLCLESTKISIEDFEEINCTLDETRWDQMDETSKKIYKRLKSAKKSHKNIVAQL